MTFDEPVIQTVHIYDRANNDYRLNWNRPLTAFPEMEVEIIHFIVHFKLTFMKALQIKCSSIPID